jgi:hypothetical protein
MLVEKDKVCKAVYAASKVILLQMEIIALKGAPTPDKLNKKLTKWLGRLEKSLKEDADIAEKLPKVTETREHRVYVNPDEREEYLRALKAVGYGLIYNDDVGLYDEVDRFDVSTVKYATLKCK